MERVERDENVRIKEIISLDRSKIPPDGGSRFNRLIFAGSPYLLQHAENPVDWYEWGEEAFKKAAAEQKPIFLSIGYATCHWCHVMAHESFEDAEVAEVLNRHFISIKVDREERADVDSRYMMVAQMLTGSGGWPLNVFMTPDRKPFYSATYLPRRGRGEMPGIIALLEKIAEMWRTERAALEQSAAAVVEGLKGIRATSPGMHPGDEIFHEATAQLAKMYDGDYGGFGGAPKFPMPTYLAFLLRVWRRFRDERAMRMVTHTLLMMRDGGIYDQLGFGFHRYAVDRRWLVPHFEKMLYDQALLAQVYLEAYQATGREFFWTVADEIFSFVRKELTSPEGAFHAALDADSEGGEGRYYVWSAKEVREILGQELAVQFCTIYDVTEGGNFEGENILHLNRPPELVADLERRPIPQVMENMERARTMLLEKRQERIRPFRDEKLIASWNGLMVAALARGYAATGQEAYLTMASRCIDFILKALVDGSGRLMRSHHLGRTSIPGFLEDYAHLLHGLLELHQATLEERYLKAADRFARDMRRLFEDREQGGFFDSGADTEPLLVDAKESYDGVIPSGNAVAAYELLRLGRILDDDELTAAGEKILHSFMGGVGNQPVGHLYMLSAFDFLSGPEISVTFAGPKNDQLREMLAVTGKTFNPTMVIRYRSDFPVADGKATAHLCASGTCRPAVTTAEELRLLLEEVIRTASR